MHFTYKTKNARDIYKCMLAITIFIFALYLRLRMIAAISHILSHDAINYDAMARQFLNNGVLGYMSQKPNAYVTPGYPIFLSVIYSIFGYDSASRFMQVRVAQAVLGAATCILIFAIAKRLFNSRASIFALFISAVYPTFVWAPSLILTEVLYTFLFVLYIYIQIYAIDKSTKFSSILSGAVFALAVLVRPLMFPLFFIPFIMHYLTTGNKTAFRQLAAAIIGVVLTMMPWWIRNYISLHKIVVLATQTGNPLIAGTFPYFTHIDYSRYQVENQFAEGLRLIWNGFISNPMLYLKWYTVGKFNYIFGKMWLDMPAEATFMRSFTFIHYFIVVMGWLGAVFTIIKKKLNIISVFLVALTIMQLAFVPEPRYAYALMPLLIILAAYLTDYIFWGSKPLTDAYKQTYG